MQPYKYFTQLEWHGVALLLWLVTTIFTIMLIGKLFYISLLLLSLQWSMYSNQQKNPITLFLATIPIFLTTIPMFLATIPMFLATIPMFWATIPMFLATIPMFLATIPNL